MAQGRTSISGSRLKSIIYLTAIIGGYIAFFYISSIVSGKNITTCPFKNITGVQCPGCGMGRATLELTRFNFKESLMVHPLAIPFNVAVLLSVFWLLKDLIRRSNSFEKFVKTKPNKWVVWVICLMLLVVWGRNVLITL